VKQFWKAYIKNLYLTWRWLGKIAAVLMIAFLAMLLVSWMGSTKNIETTLNACLLTEDGEVLNCQVYIKGELNRYPLRHGADYFYTEPLGTGVRGISINGRPGIGELYCNDSHETLLIGASDRGVYFMDRKASLMFAETDLKYVFPELDSKRCVVAAPASNLEEMKQLLEGQPIPKYHWERFAWLMEIA